MIYDLFSDQPIYAYTRKQAIADGVLADLTDNKIIKVHWQYPLATTSRVWSTIETAISEDDNDLDGILHDLSVLAKIQLLASDKDGIVRFPAKIGRKTCELKLHIGPGDGHEPVLTLMFIDED